MKKMKRLVLATITITTVLLTAIPGTGIRIYAQDAHEKEAADALLAEQRLNAWYSQAIQSLGEEDYEKVLMCLNGCEP